MLILVSCATGELGKDPESKYVRATGYGATMDEAELNAKTALASLFGMSVTRDTTRALMETNTSNSYGEEYSAYGEYFTNISSVIVKADNLYGVQVVDRVKGKDECAVTVVMERKTTSEYYLAQIESALESIMALESLIPTEIGTMKALEDAVLLANLGEECNTQTVMYNYLSGEEHAFYSLSRAYELIVQSRRAILLDVTVAGDDSGSVKSAISKVFADAGIPIVKGDQKPTAIAEVTIVWQESKGTGVASSFVFEEYNADISIMDMAGSQVVFVTSLNGKEGHQTYDGAKTRATKGLVSEIETSIRPEFSKRFSL